MRRPLRSVSYWSCAAAKAPHPHPYPHPPAPGPAPPLAVHDQKGWPALLTAPRTRFMFHKTPFGDVEHVTDYRLAEEVGGPRTRGVARDETRGRALEMPGFSATACQLAGALPELAGRTGPPGGSARTKSPHRRGEDAGSPYLVSALSHTCNNSC